MTWLAVAGGAFLGWLVLVFLFTPGINYHLARRTSVHADDFLYTIQSTCQAALHHGYRVTVLTDGAAFYPAMLDAIRGAKRSINMECYIFQGGRIADQFIDALAERSRNGVNVTIVVDAIGSFNLWGRPVARLRAAGCRIEAYQRLRWYSLHRINNRTHRELLVVDGAVAFAGGAVRISTPYFLPDRALRRALLDTTARGVGITVILPGRSTDQKWVRLASRRMWGHLLRAGVRIFEFRDAMTHAKVLIVDNLWAVMGTTNIDNRSFEHNDEVNVAMRDPAVADRLLQDYERDLATSDEVTLERWERRPLGEKIVGPFVWILERQQ